MCRWIAYIGEAIFMDTIITKPKSSLIVQSIESKMSFKPDGSILTTNGDGFGIGWYSRQKEPGLFKSSEPAWANENLNEICHQTKAKIFMAHVRAASTGAVQRSNAHPFKYKNWLFQHNGFVNNFDEIRRDLHNILSDDLYKSIKGTTDSEVIFKVALNFGLEENPKQALEKTICHLSQVLKNRKIKPEFALSCALSNGKAIYTIRFATIQKPNSQFYSTREDCMKNIGDNSFLIPKNSVVVVSEPLNHFHDNWREVPHKSFTTIQDGKVKIEPLEVEI
jgi:predicted glutamine amidotransferase